MNKQPTIVYEQATLATGQDLRTIAHTQLVQDISSLPLPEIDYMVNQVAKVTPAGNVPAMILNGLIRIPTKQLSKKSIRQDINLLFRGVQQTLQDGAVYTAFFAGPAAVLLAYQSLLKLAGKDVDKAFPEGTWQFYVEYALRDDPARHANETHGFDTTLKQHGITLNIIDRITAWAMASIYILHQYENLVANEWRERVYTYILREVTRPLPQASKYEKLYRQWELQRPYARGADVDPQDDYPAYRRKKFDQFIETALQNLPPAVRRQWTEKVKEAKEQQLSAYQQQMSLRVYLEAEAYGEQRIPIPLENLHVGVIHNGRYYLIPACQTGSDKTPSAATIRGYVASILARPADHPPTQLTPLAELKRTALVELWDSLSEPLRKDLALLRLAPIWLNFDRRPADLPLAEIRNAERGIGDHPLTIFDTGRTFVFDQSHILFDGAWGAALAEVMTNEAMAWAVYLNTLPPATPSKQRPYSPALPISPAELQKFYQAPTITPSVTAESSEIDLRNVLRLRQLFKRRSDLLGLTVNDLLVLYRAIHAHTYRPEEELEQTLKKLVNDRQTSVAAKAALSAIQEGYGETPAILIPIDASQRSPRDRLYPLTFQVPLDELNLVELHQQTYSALHHYEQTRQETDYQTFHEGLKQYLGVLAAFGQVSNRAKEVANEGKSDAVSTIKLLAHMPKGLQNLLNGIPDRFDVLNDIIKGREVFSNVGAVVPSSTLSRFITAKDDNEKKTLCWGVLTDAQNQMHISLRDFRPHVGLLKQAQHLELAQQITTEYLSAYVNGFNTFVRELRQMVSATR